MKGADILEPWVSRFYHDKPTGNNFNCRDIFICLNENPKITKEIMQFKYKFGVGSKRFFMKFFRISFRNSSRSLFRNLLEITFRDMYISDFFFKLFTQFQPILGTPYFSIPRMGKYQVKCHVIYFLDSSFFICIFSSGEITATNPREISKGNLGRICKKK